MTIYCWTSYDYYDGLLCFSQIKLVPDPYTPLTYFRVRWLGSTAEYSRVEQAC